MGLSSNRNGPLTGGGQMPPGVQQPNPFGTAPHGPADPNLYPGLRQMGQHGPFGGLLASVLMHGLEQRRLSQGMSPQDWQAKLNSFYQQRNLPTYVPPSGT